MARPTAHKSVGLSVAMLLWVLLISTLSVSAQANATPINVGENKAGEIVDPDVSVLYSLTVGAPMSINLQVLAITSGFAPNFRVLDPAGVVILDSANPGAQAIVRAALNLSSANAAYTVEVRSANNTPGQFLISLEAGTPLAAPQPLTAGTAVEGLVDDETTRQVYTFSGALDDVLLLNVQVTDAETGAVIALRDADNGDLLSVSSARLGSINMRILSGAANYRLDMSHDGGRATNFVICLTAEDAAATCPDAAAGNTADVTPTVVVAAPSLTPTFAPVALDPNGACQVTSARGTAINVRGGAGTNFGIVGSLSPNGTGLVIGRLADNSWFQVNVNGTLGWVSATVVILGGNCAGVSIVTLPTTISADQCTHVNGCDHCAKSDPDPDAAAATEHQCQFPKCYRRGYRLHSRYSELLLQCRLRCRWHSRCVVSGRRLCR